MKRTQVLNTNIAANLPAETAERPAFPQALLDHIMTNYKQPSGLIGENGSIGNETGNVRNGH